MLCVAINWGKAFTDRWFFLRPTQAEWQKEGGKFKTSLFFICVPIIQLRMDYLFEATSPPSVAFPILMVALIYYRCIYSRGGPTGLHIIFRI